MTDADKMMNPQHFGSDPADIGNRIRINSDIRIIMPYHFLVEVGRLGGGFLGSEISETLQHCTFVKSLQDSYVMV